MNYSYEESTVSELYDTILDHLDSLHDRCKDESDEANRKLNTAYAQRAIAAVALAHTILQHGGRAGVGQDDREDQPDAWRVVLYVDTAAGQLSWHIAPDDQLMLVGLPQYAGSWDGRWNSSNTQFYKGFVKC